jgi:hypothetical protein
MLVTNRVCDDTTAAKKHPGAAMAEAHRFMLDGVDYEIDLCADHGAELAGMIAYYADAGRRISGPGRRRNASSPGGPRTAADRRLAADKRDWARTHGYKVPERGRIPAAAEEAYWAARS